VTGPAYLVPATIDEAVAALAGDEDAMAMAGATSVVLLMKQGLVAPSVLVDLAAIPGLAEITDRGSTLEIGALTTLRAIETSPIVRSRIPALASAVGRVATVRVRNQATIGGNIAHADPAQDPPPILLALDAELEIVGPDGPRRAQLDGFFVDVFETTLGPGELITGVRVPVPGPASRVGTEKFLSRTVDDYATVSVAARLDLGADGVVADARIAIGAGGPTPLRAHEAEAHLVGRRPTREAIRHAAGLAAAATDPIADLRGSAEYKREMAGIWTRRLLERLAGIAPVPGPGGAA
jgi:carbon-monoxide dehydrogenase medium subunit